MFKSEGNLKRHTESAHEPVEHACDTCDAVFKNRQGLVDHEGVHTGEYRCPWCKSAGRDKDFSNSRALKRHCLSAHKDGCKEATYKEDLEEKRTETRETDDETQ
jgi:hypothetical protein